MRFAVLDDPDDVMFDTSATAVQTPAQEEVAEMGQYLKKYMGCEYDETVDECQERLKMKTINEEDDDEEVEESKEQQSNDERLKVWEEGMRMYRECVEGKQQLSEKCKKMFMEMNTDEEWLRHRDVKLFETYGWGKVLANHDMVQTTQGELVLLITPLRDLVGDDVSAVSATVEDIKNGSTDGKPYTTNVDLSTVIQGVEVEFQIKNPAGTQRSEYLIVPTDELVEKTDDEDLPTELGTLHKRKSSTRTRTRRPRQQFETVYEGELLEERTENVWERR